MGQGLSNALPPKYFGPIVAKISYFEVNAKISEFHFFKNHRKINENPLKIQEKSMHFEKNEILRFLL